MERREERANRRNTPERRSKREDIGRKQAERRENREARREKREDLRFRV